MKRTGRAVMMAAVMGLAAAAAAAQTAIPNLDQYAKGATNVTNVELNKSMLGLAGGFMDKRDKDQAQVKNLMSNLDGIYVHTFQYDRDWAYDRKSVTDVRKMFAGPDWSNIVSQHSAEKGDTDIWMHTVNGTVEGMMIVTAEARELTFVEIDGQLKPEDLKALGGNFGVPPMPPVPPKKPGHSEMEMPGMPGMMPPPPPPPTMAMMPGGPGMPGMMLPPPQDPRPMLDYSGHPSPQSPPTAPPVAQ